MHIKCEGKDYLKDEGIDGRIILEWILGKWWSQWPSGLWHVLFLAA
jgi:hypothetical protein